MPDFQPIQQIDVVCPYCGETVTIAVEADLGGDLVQDCAVCCHPWELRLRRESGRLSAQAARLDD